MLNCRSAYIQLTIMEILKGKMPAAGISIGHLVVGSRNVRRYIQSKKENWGRCDHGGPWAPAKKRKLSARNLSMVS